MTSQHGSPSEPGGAAAPDRADLHVDLPQDLTAPGAARSAARAALGRWALALLMEPVALVVSELVTNAVRYGRPPVWMRLRRTGDGVYITVHDEDSGHLPAVGPASADAESGRGLAIVQALTVESGCDSVEGDGKVVWARVDAAQVVDAPADAADAADAAPADDAPTAGPPAAAPADTGQPADRPR